MDKGEAIQRLIESGVMPTPDAIKNILESSINPAAQVKAEAPSITESLTSVEVLPTIEANPKKYEVKDFVTYFRNRYEYFKNLLINRPELTNTTSIARLQQGEKTTIIATIHSMKKLTTGTLKLTLEDLTGRIDTIISVKNAQVLKTTHLAHDEVLGFRGVVGKNVFFVDELIWPDIQHKQITKTPDEVYVACAPDLHVGSNMFLEKEFCKFVKWLGGGYGNPKQREIGKKTKYIIVCGDIVDGVGIYPNQDKEQNIKDIYQQYETAARLLSQIPSDRHIIISPGNHDAMRICEPQFLLYKDFAEALYKLPNAILVPNPSYIRLHKSEKCKGVEILIYHGYSFDYFIDSVESLRLAGGYDAADKVWEFLLKRRHLAPTYGATLALPLEQDPLLIKNVPDIVMSGHIHKAKIGRYRGVLIISGGCWQATTTFQQRMGHNPDPCCVPIINLQTGTAKMFRFR
jgi:DNA polymerase II small subunit